MGVPKFFRWMSERYPAISQLIAENRIPEFDALYLDMNGIIHNCTHSDSDTPLTRLSEDQMWIAIFNYIEHLFGKIKPKKLFFMAVDGVAPRAKMNQQRSRRFRTALDAEKAREKAIKEGVEMPKEPPFDSNAITPGTPFMARLTEQLKYFINKKMSEDADWRGVEIVLSGHEVPGEGEHKIMEYIRQAKSQPGYDPNVRHCLYGLDADLIMLGLLSHDPHFCLLREEVTFGRQNQKKSKELEHQNFYLMHLCVVREYLELEFQNLKKPGSLGFSFDMERVIDDFILMAFFVGNDFLPNLPYLHINEGALALMFDTYKSVLRKTDGYINDKGTINLQRLGLLLDELSEVEFRFFESENADASWMKSKQTMDVQEEAKDAKRGKLTISTPQRDLYRNIKKWVNNQSSSFAKTPYDCPSSLPARDREFVKTLAESMHLEWKTIEDDAGERHMQLLFPKTMDVQDEDEEEEEPNEEAQAALFRVMKRYDNAKVVDISPDQAQDQMQKKYDEKFVAWKDKYYTTKFEFGLDNEEEMRKLTENYVQGLQWVLYYYYRGIVSWPWFFTYHYSPMISDVKKGLGADLNFRLGQPFHPFEQLMGVLPDRSKTIVPEAFRDLMSNPDSPIIDFYPRDFELDMNGKKQEWEAVVKIPFINEERLLAAMNSCAHLLSDEERQRNSFGATIKFTHSPDMSFTYPSSLPGVFNDIPNCHCIQNIFELPTMDGLDYHVGLVDGVKLGRHALAGFPSLKNLPFYGELAYHGVSVFQQESRNQSMVITLLDAETETKSSQAKKKLGQIVHVGYPFLQEAKIVKISDELFDYVMDSSGQVEEIQHGPHDITDFKKKADRIENVYSKRLGVIIGTVEALIHVEMLTGMLKTDRGDSVKVYGDIPGVETTYAAQTIVDTVFSPDERFIEREALPIQEEFPLGSKVFFLGEAAFGRPGQVDSYAGEKVNVWVLMAKTKDEAWAKKIVRDCDRRTPYTPAYAVAQMLKLNSLALSKLTSSFSVNSSSLRLNLGLNLKFEAKKLKVLGYSRKGPHGWEYSQKAIDLIVQYMTNFPDFIAGLQRNPSGDQFQDTDFYPADLAPAKMKDIGKFLKSVESKSFERVPLDAEQLDSDAVAAIEQRSDQILAEAPKPTPKKVSAVPRHAVLKPADAEHRLSDQDFTVGDRVVYVQDSGKVPLGMSATVVGITRSTRTTFLDVVMDVSHMSGTTLDNRCSPFRGATVAASTVLNLTDRQVIADTRASAARQPIGNSKPYHVNGYGAPLGPGGQGQLFEAKAPPPLRGSFRGAVSGQQQALPIRNGSSSAQTNQRGRGGYRGNPRGNGNTGHSSRAGLGFQSGPTASPRGGRGGAPNTKGFTIIDNSDPTDGVIQNNPNFRPQSYANVPPPSDLQNSPRGRGNGRGGRGASRGRNTKRGGPAVSATTQT